MRHPSLRLLLAVPLTACGPPQAGEQPIRFAALEAHERIEVYVRSRGCFHDEKASFRFTRRRDGGLDARSSRRDAYAFWKRRARLDTTLPARDAAALDSLLAYYRSPSRGWCTTEEEIAVILFRSGRTVRTERYSDATCPGFTSGTRSIYDIVLTER
ncbi:MAG TPA: hypothetical protein VHG08_20720 [Longimicrobium sp.]|nr:hypothetical protein [Longimicrobium sp.]